jgi:HAE1 family hydrophobic/amphiphilic exporter-1
MNFSALFIKKPIMTFYVMLTILIAGYVAFTKLPVNDLPNIEYPIIAVATSYTGAMPETIVQNVTIPLEREFNGIKGIKEINSTSGRGTSNIFLQFHFGTDVDDAAREVQAAIDRAAPELPLEIDARPTYKKIGASNTAHIMYMIMTSSNYSIGDMRDYADTYIQKRLERINGVARVDLFGTRNSIRIQVNPELMATRGIAFDEVIATVKKHNGEIPMGAIKTGTRALTLELDGRLKDVEDLRNLVIAAGPVYLKDVANVLLAPESSQEFYFTSNGTQTRALCVGVAKQNSANAVEISKQVREELKEINRDLPPSITLDLWFDKALWIHESIADVSWSLIFAFILVALVIYLSLGRLSEAVIPSIALPMSLVGTFIIMYASDFSLDILSLLALTLSVGFVVDDAIVVLENIVRHQEQGESPMEASLAGAKQISFTIVSMTLSLVAVFIPLLFMGGMNGLLFKEFSVTLAVAIIISGFISLSLTPMLCSRFLRKHHTETALQTTVRKANQKMVDWYHRNLSWCIRHPKTIFAIAIASFIITIPLFKGLPIRLFPNEDRGFIHSFMTMPEGLSDTIAREYQDKVMHVAQSNPHVLKSLTFRWDAHLIAFMELVNPSQRPEQSAVIGQIQQELDAVPGLQAFTGGMQLINMGMEGGDNGYAYLLQGMDSETVKAEAKKLQATISAGNSFTSAHLSYKEDSPQLVVNILEEQAQKLNVDRRAVQMLLQQAYSEGSISKIQKGSLENKIYVELAPGYKGQLKSLDALHIKNTTDTGSTTIPLRSIATWKETLGTPSIQRVDQLSAITLNYVLKPEVAPNKGLETMKNTAVESLPASVSGKHHGMAAIISDTSNESLLLFLAAFAVMYVVLGILYESLVHPLTILSSLPFACLGGVLTLLIFNEPLSLYSLVGFLLLIGIVKKNGIMMIDYALEAQRNRNLTAEQAIVEGSLVRFRPIMMTTFAAIMGAVPIAIGFGDGAEARRGLGLVIAGGLMFSQMLTLFFTPVLFLAVEKLRNKVLRKR